MKHIYGIKVPGAKIRKESNVWVVELKSGSRFCVMMKLLMIFPYVLCMNGLDENFVLVMIAVHFSEFPM
jgi:hypothetical protein